MLSQRSGIVGRAIEERSQQEQITLASRAIPERINLPGRSSVLI
jgi:hypothetical protein